MLTDSGTERECRARLFAFAFASAPPFGGIIADALTSTDSQRAAARSPASDNIKRLLNSKRQSTPSKNTMARFRLNLDNELVSRRKTLEQLRHAYRNEQRPLSKWQMAAFTVALFFIGYCLTYAVNHFAR